MCVDAHRNDDGSFRGILCVHVDDTIFSFSTALTTLRRRFPFRKWQIGEGMFCGSKHVLNKVTKEIMISPTEFAAKIVKIPMSAARRKMREDLDKAEIHAFRGVSGSVSLLAGQRLVLMSHVKCLNCNKLFHRQQLHKFAHRAWWFAGFISIRIWVSRSGEFPCKT